MNPSFSINAKGLCFRDEYLRRGETVKQCYLKRWSVVLN